MEALLGIFFGLSFWSFIVFLAIYFFRLLMKKDNPNKYAKLAGIAFMIALTSLIIFNILI
ncbi:hypothetical protein [Priestia taiwanensis]|uniref:Uncharacterized protein n=1 Tax=Priestia taiwanensis TaxID=1347902 RepID=A0A917AK00_9BACI|nr:hypothetical protein [Priestia taiwanensis]MBM7361942.1 putative membrane protein [Priestia taiwanensis]GGE58237.1 hypothetical protein GCM10007140_05700 [Priestia taiwanensis]